MRYNVIFDMETQDPDDVLTLCWIGCHPKINLLGVTITPGTQEQVGLIKRILLNIGKTLPVGSFDSSRKEGAVNPFLYKGTGFNSSFSEPEAEGADLIQMLLEHSPDATLLTGAPLKNLHQFLLKYPNTTLEHWIGNGGFAGDSLVEPEHRLPKFAGRETCPTFNFNGDPKGALLALSSKQIKQRTLVSKNVCHGVVYDRKFHELFKTNKDANRGMTLIYQVMERYLEKRPEGKKLHDPLAAATLVNPDICTFAEEVELYRASGEWGARRSENTRTKISVSVDYEKFTNRFINLDSN